MALIKKTFPFILCLTVILAGCGPEKKEEKKKKPEIKREVNVPEFNPDSAYSFIEKQVSFGPRVPNTQSHLFAAEYLEAKLKQYTPHVRVQEGKVEAFNGDILNIRNIIASFHPENKRKILLCAHWDTRPFADMDTFDKKKPIPGANDGGSGTGVLLEIARLLAANKPEVGVEIILFDAEDYGAPREEQEKVKSESSFCLGSQYWAKRINPNLYYADYGILLDMVGAKGATFKKEGYSMQVAPHVVNKVWNRASKLGYSGIFLNQETGPVVDDHLFVIKYANIPTIDIIEFDSNKNNSFGHYWHTHGDNMEIIGKETLRAVGQTVTAVIFYEKGF